MKKMTTIKISQETKKRLDDAKRPIESYDQALDRILKEDELEKDLAEAYAEQEKYHKELLEDWDKIQDGDW